MYFSNLSVDSVVRKIPEIFCFDQKDEKAFNKKTAADDDFVDGSFPVEPVYWVQGAANAGIESYRGTGATSVLHGADDGLVIQLNTGARYESFIERKYQSGTMPVKASSDSVLGQLEARSLWPNVADNVSGPVLNAKGETENNAALDAFVTSGKHVHGIAARLVALGIEHALCPFNTRTRVRNAAASYWCTGKYRSDSITYSLQNTQSILDWAHPGSVGTEVDPTVVVWVGAAEKVRGMSLLSRLMDQGGPVYGQESHLLKQFDPGRCLMVGTGALRRDFKSVEASDLLDAIDEALWILMTYNNLTNDFIVNAQRLILRNLPHIDLAHYRESDNVFWRVSEATHGPPDLGAAMEVDLDRLVDRHFSQNAKSAGFDNSPAIWRGVLSDLFRHELMKPAAGWDGLAPSTLHDVDWRVMGMLAGVQSPALGVVDGYTVHTAVFDPSAPPALPVGMAALERKHLDGVMSCFSGRAGYHLYAYTAPRTDPLNPNPPGNGWALAAPVPADLTIPAGVAADGDWVSWTGGADNNGVPHTVDSTMRAYVVRQWVPPTPDQFLNGYVAPSAQLRRFDVGANMRMATTPGGRWPDLETLAPRVKSFVDSTARGGDPLDYLTEDGQRAMAALGAAAKSMAVMVGIAYCWDAANGGRQQNDAYKRWSRDVHADRRLTTSPDELKLYIGGMRSRKYLEACGGLWSLCFTKAPKMVKARGGHEELMAILRDSGMLASYILKLRCAVEMADQMGRISNSRITGCAEPFLWPSAVDDRLNRGRIDQLTVMDPATYLARQALILACVFDHPDCSVGRTFGVTASSTLRLREPRVGITYDIDAMKHLNWMAPQTLRYPTWGLYFGVAAPTFVPDRQSRGWLHEARFTTTWQRALPEFKPGAMISREDEIWMAVLTGYAFTDWLPAAVELAQFGSKLIVDTSQIRKFHYEGYTQPAMRMNLPYETRMAVVTVFGNDHEDETRPFLPCDGNGQWIAGVALPQTTVSYDSKGKVTGVVLDPTVNDSENIDLRDTTFASDGLRFAAFQAAKVLGPFAPVEQSVGQFWLSVMHIEKGVSAGFGAGPQRLLSFLAPPGPVPSSEDSGGKEVQSAARMGINAPDVQKQSPAGAEGQGDLPLHEILSGSDAATIISSLSGVSIEVQEMLRNALLKNKPTAGDSTATTTGLTSETDDADN